MKIKLEKNETYTISLFERLIVGSGILLFIGIIAYIILFAVMCMI